MIYSVLYLQVYNKVFNFNFSILDNFWSHIARRSDSRVEQTKGRQKHVRKGVKTKIEEESKIYWVKEV